ncbi:hypothetical protein V5O48_005824 [Marasmius crinis-equi]|uniref:Uncharacterized protein n=1 Tax=Marasmius crinis-equi TaxID=585013 RepID=A0ABR3FL74_9AGAR
MVASSRLFTHFPANSYPAVPPVSLADIDELEKVLIRKELKYALINRIEAAAALRGIRDRRYGYGHLWTSWRVSLGVSHWPDVGRLYRKCIALGHWKRHYPCVSRPRFMTRRLRHEQLTDIEEMRALYDVLGEKKWSATYNAGGNTEVERARWIRFMWRERERPTLETLGAVLWRILDSPTDEEYDSGGWETDTATDSSWIVAEPDSDEDLDCFNQTDVEEEEEKDDGDMDPLEEAEVQDEVQSKREEV